MRRQLRAATIAIPILMPLVAFCEARLNAPDFTVGKNLEASGNITLSEQAPEGGLQIVLQSSDPNRLRFSLTPDAAGAASVNLKMKTGSRESPDFWVQALGNSGTVTYQASAPGFGDARGTVTMAPSAIIIMGPFRGPMFRTTSGAVPSPLALFPVRLDASLNHVEQQVVAGGTSVSVNVTSSNPAVGKIAESQVIIAGGTASGSTEFRPAAKGDTVLAVSVPPGFTAPAKFASITASVMTPGISVADRFAVGCNLQVTGHVGLGEAAPADGVVVTVTSSDPSRMLLSVEATEIGSESIRLKIPAGGISAPYYIQALAGSGTVDHTASAPGYTSRTGTVKLTPSGAVVTPRSYGPPDEAEVLRPGGSDSPRGFVTQLAAGRDTMPLVVWMMQLDPVTKRGADITVQPLRAGMSVTVLLKSSNPSVGTVTSPVILAGGADHAVAEFRSVSAGSTVISASTPDGFTTPGNSTSLPALVRP